MTKLKKERKTIMKKLLLASLAIVAFASAANAETNVCVRPYISAKVTYGKLEMDGRLSDATDTFKTAKTDWAWGGSGAVGLKMCAFRTEFEYNQPFTTSKDTREYTIADVSRGSQFYRSYMLNGYFDIPTYTPVHPYVGAGVGLARVKNRLAILTDPTGPSVTKNSETNIAYQLMAGVGYNLTCNWTLDVGYRWVDNGYSSWNVGPDYVKFDSTEHQLTMGLRYTF